MAVSAQYMHTQMQIKLSLLFSMSSSMLLLISVFFVAAMDQWQTSSSGSVFDQWQRQRIRVLVILASSQGERVWDEDAVLSMAMHQRSPFFSFDFSIVIFYILHPQLFC